jgi:D-glycero-alpha-D-manno-heptose-7-phosphate kinase
MIIGRTPYRVSFFGGGTDFPQWYNNYKGLTLSTSIDYYIYLTIRNLPSFFKDINYRISYSKLENVKNLNDIKLKAVREMLKYLKIKSPLELHVDSDLPARSGLGSSSAFIVCLIGSINNFLGKKISNKRLFQEAIHFEQNILRDFCGSQDQVITSLGGFKKTLYTRSNISSTNIKILESQKDKLENSLILIFTGFSRNANIVEKNKIKFIEQNYISYHQLYDIALEAKNIFETKNSNLNDIGKLFHESWLIKKQLSKKVTNNKIDDLYNYAISNGAIGGKLLGAGNGGFFLFYVESNKKEFLLKKLKKFQHVPFKFTNNGYKVIYRSNEKIKI